MRILPSAGIGFVSTFHFAGNFFSTFLFHIVILEIFSLVLMQHRSHLHIY